MGNPVLDCEWGPWLGWDTGQDDAQGWQQVKVSPHWVLMSDGTLPWGQEELYLLHLDLYPGLVLPQGPSAVPSPSPPR